MIEYMDGHRNFAIGRVKSKEARAVASTLWRELSCRLNVEGPSRTGKEWAKVWNDLKSRVRAKLIAINVNSHATGGGPNKTPVLSAHEDRVADIIGRDIGPLPNNNNIGEEEEIVFLDMIIQAEDMPEEMPNENESEPEPTL